MIDSEGTAKTARVTLQNRACVCSQESGLSWNMAPRGPLAALL